nr:MULTISPECIES: GntR family transcriptional regulator [unclassified Oceanispirochaeta]
MEELKNEIVNQKKYRRVYDYIKIFIDQNKFTLNNKLPSENFLCSKFSVSRETVRLAMKILRDEGRIYSVKGSGTFFDRNYALKENGPEDRSKIQIGFITQGYDYNTSSNLVRGIKHSLNKDSIELKIFITDNKLSNERSCLKSCSTGFDGLIVDGVKASIMNPNLDCYSLIDKKNTRLIFFNNYYMGSPYPRVTIDDAQCADELVRRLTENGHRHIAGIFMYDNYQGQEKYNGFMRNIIKYDAVFKDEYVKWCVSDESFNKKSFPGTLWKFIKSLPRVTAIVCCNYMVLNMIMEIFAEKGISVPGDYSVVGFDYSGSDWKERKITASIHPGFEMGVKVGQNILKMVDDPDFRNHDYSYVFPPHINEGESIRNLKE